MNYIGIDLGTSSVKLVLMDTAGHIIANVSKSYPIDYPKAGWSEQNPYDWYDACMEGMKELLDGQDESTVGGISFGGQMHGLVILDKNDEVIRPAILWNDGRTTKQCEYLNEVIGRDKLSEYTANIAFAGFTAPKILWVKENEPDNFAKIDKIMLPKDYIAYRLTGVHCTDVSDASGMLLFDVKNRRWSRQMLDICGVTEAQMPVTMIRLNLVKGIGPTLQIAEGWTVKLPEEVTDILWKRTDYTWPCTWFAPRCNGKEGPFKSAYDVMNNWGANHGAISYGHVGADLITLCSMLRIPVSMHNVPEEKIFRPASWNAFGMDKEGQDYRACAAYGPMYK